MLHSRNIMKARRKPQFLKIFFLAVAMLVGFLSVVNCAHVTKFVRRIENGICAESKLGDYVGRCPRSIVTFFGKLETSKNCAKKNYTQFMNLMTVQAGPCGRIVFACYNRPKFTNTKGVWMTHNVSALRKQALRLFDLQKMHLK